VTRLRLRQATKAGHMQNGSVVGAQRGATDQRGNKEKKRPQGQKKERAQPSRYETTGNPSGHPRTGGKKKERGMFCP